MKLFLILIANLVYLCNHLVNASEGDRDPLYSNCVHHCVTQNCNFDVHNRITSAAPCYERCSFDCIANITAERLSNNQRVLKYFGHWPFDRILGFEEPASSFFSFLNIMPHITNIFFSRTLYPSGYAMKPWLKIYPYIAINTWIWSTLYHYKRNSSSEFLDLSSALSFLAYSLWIAILRINMRFLSNFYVIILLFLFLFLCPLTYQILRMLQGLVPFSEHMFVCIIIATIHTILWIFWACIVRNKIGLLAILWQLYFIAAAAFEIFDFPPYFGIFDAHSLWHAATIPLGFFVYYFWRCDVEDLIRKKVIKSE